ncbi:MAG: flippase-like domain-containing protein [Candidatus Rokuibacteriota bacterium]
MRGWRAARLLLIVGGAVLLAVLVARNDPRALLDTLATLSWRILIVLAFPFPLVNLFDTLGWRFAFRHDRVPLRTLYFARLAGEAVNVTTPTASLGGEAVKAWLVRRHVSVEAATSSVIVAKTTIAIAQGWLLVVGIACAWWVLPPDSAVLRGMEWLLLVEVVAVGLFVAAQVGGLFAGGGRLLKRFGMLASDSAGLTRLDDSLSAFYRGQPRRLSLSIVFHFLGWLTSALETWVILALLGIEVSLLTAVVIEAFSTAIRFATFMVPGSLGALEGGHVAIFVALGFTGTAGLSYSLVRRIREATWVGIGFIALVVLRSGDTAVAVPTADG